MSPSKNNGHPNAGFTLIELMVVFAVIALLTSVILASINVARTKARDARRLTDIKQIQQALELYYNDHRQYPPYNQARTGNETCGGNAAWCNFMTAMGSYLKDTFKDPLGSQTGTRYYYDADSGDGYTTYGFMVEFEDSSNFNRSNTDGGFYQGVDCCYHEVGPQPHYCVVKYGTGTNGNWWGTENTVCIGGN